MDSTMELPAPHSAHMEPLKPGQSDGLIGGAGRSYKRLSIQTTPGSLQTFLVQHRSFVFDQARSSSFGNASCTNTFSSGDNRDHDSSLGGT
jgi:hypothetical protein